ALCGIRLLPGMADFRLIDGEVLKELNHMQESQIFLRGLLSWTGYRQAIVPFEPGPRYSGTTKYTLRKMLHLAKGGVFSFSTVPLRIGVWIGLTMALLSFAELIYVLIVYLAGRTQPGWASIIFVMSFLLGILFLLIGLQGEYLLRIYQRVSHRPPYLVERTVRRKSENPEGS
ncbi:MAG: glycosyltransferase, partial [Phycisphaerae bacterium]|nr:glycosyltransferase [Phycisphaerae bacterium]